MLQAQHSTTSGAVLIRFLFNHNQTDQFTIKIIKYMIDVTYLK